MSLRIPATCQQTSATTVVARRLSPSTTTLDVDVPAPPVITGPPSGGTTSSTAPLTWTAPAGCPNSSWTGWPCAGWGWAESKTLVITLWADDASLRASAEAGDHLGGLTAETVGTTRLALEDYEVSLFDVAGA